MTVSRVLHIAIFAILILAGGAFLGVLLLRSKDNKILTAAGYNHTIMVGDEYIPVSVADDDQERNLGLSGVPMLPKNAGKYFIFEDPAIYQFWMKDMEFPIDMVWINEAGTVVEITKDVPPDSYPQTYQSQEPIKYVLEVNAGFSTARDIQIGDSVTVVK